MRPDSLLDRLDVLPRVTLAVAPTPLVRARPLERVLEAEVGQAVPRILLKLDSYTGFGLGGNKVRKLEYVLAPERLEGVTHLISAGGVQSNHARVTAAAAARLGLECVLVLNGAPPERPRGNAWLQRRFGSRVISVRDREERDPTMREAAEEVRAGGGCPLVIPIGASTPLGALGYARAGREFVDQLRSGGADGRVTVFIASSSCGTLAGLHLAFSAMADRGIRLIGVSADASRAELLDLTRDLALGAGALLDDSGARHGLPNAERDGERASEPDGAPDGGSRIDLDGSSLDADDRFVGEGYGIPTLESDEASALLGRAAGVLLDSTYTAKAAACMLARIRSGQAGPEDTWVFWHTGGWPAALP